MRSGEGDKDRSEGDQRATEELQQGEVFAQEDPGAEDDEDDAELVDWSDARGGTHLQGAEVAQPGEAGA